MTVYIAVTTYISFMEGTSREVHGVFTTPEKADQCLRNQPGFERAEFTRMFEWLREYDGELSVYYQIVPTKLDEELQLT